MLPDGMLPDETTQDAVPSHGRFGVALVEMALVLPIFLAIVGGVSAFGRAAIVTQALHDAARAGTRHAAEAGATNESVRTIVLESLAEATGMATDDVAVEILIEPAPGNADPANEIGRSHPKDEIHIRLRLPPDKAAWLMRLLLQETPLTGESQVRRAS